MAIHIRIHHHLSIFFYVLASVLPNAYSDKRARFS